MSAAVAQQVYYSDFFCKHVQLESWLTNIHRETDIKQNSFHYEKSYCFPDFYISALLTSPSPLHLKSESEDSNRETN